MSSTREVMRFKGGARNGIRRTHFHNSKHEENLLHVQANKKIHLNLA